MKKTDKYLHIIYLIYLSFSMRFASFQFNINTHIIAYIIMLGRKMTTSDEKKTTFSTSSLSTLLCLAHFPCRSHIITRNWIPTNSCCCWCASVCVFILAGRSSLYPFTLSQAKKPKHIVFCSVFTKHICTHAHRTQPNKYTNWASACLRSLALSLSPPHSIRAR